MYYDFGILFGPLFFARVRQKVQSTMPHRVAYAMCYAARRFSLISIGAPSDFDGDAYVSKLGPKTPKNGRWDGVMKELPRSLMTSFGHAQGDQEVTASCFFDRMHIHMRVSRFRL